MSLLIACKNRNGIIMAVDSKAIDITTEGNIQEMSIQRLYQLGDKAALITGGAAAGRHMAEALQKFIADENLTDIDSIYHAALPFLASEYEQFMRKTCEITPLDPIHQVHFILGGQTENDPGHPFRLYFLWTKRKLPQLDGDEIQSAFSVPRLFRMEHRLNQLCKENVGMDQILEEVHAGMQQQAEIQEEISGPFDYAVIDKNGVRRVGD